MPSDYERGRAEERQYLQAEATKKAETLGYIMEALLLEAKAERCKAKAARDAFIGAGYHRHRAEGIEHAVKAIAGAMGYSYSDTEPTPEDAMFVAQVARLTPSTERTCGEDEAAEDALHALDGLIDKARSLQGATKEGA